MRTQPIYTDEPTRADIPTSPSIGYIAVAMLALLVVALIAWSLVGAFVNPAEHGPKPITPNELPTDPPGWTS